MADIDIVHKKRTSVWLWVVLAVIAVAAIFWLLMVVGQPQAITRFLETTGPSADESFHATASIVRT